MKSGKTLNGLVAEVTDQVKSRHDYIADTRNIEFRHDGADLWMDLRKPSGNDSYGMTDLFHSQMSAHTRVPKQYYDRLKTEAPELLVRNVNHWLTEIPEKRMVRTLDSRARAFMSDKYRPLDNYDLMNAILPKLSDVQLEIKSCELTDTRLYIKAVSPKVEGEIKKNDIVQAGVVISNSEVGAGSLSVSPLLYRLVCSNGMICEDSNSMRKYHTGKRNEGDMGSWEVFSDATRKQSDKALFMQASDLVSQFLTEDYVKRLLIPIREAAGQMIENMNLPEVVEKTAKTFTLTEEEGSGIMRFLATGGDMSKWGLANAITRFSQEVTDYDRATELERIGGRLVELPQKQWQTLAVA